MPILEFECQACGHKQEFLKLSSSDPEPEECSLCHERGALVKQFPSSGSFQLKGGGWFKDKYGGKR